MFVRRWLEALVERLTARRLPVRRVFARSAITGATLSNSDKSMTVLRTSINGASFGIQATGGEDALAGNGTVDNTRATVAATLTVGSNHGSSTLSGVIQNTASKQQRAQGASR